MTDDTRSAAQRRDAVPRTVLPVPDLPHVGTVTYDAKDPDTSFPALSPLRPPTGAPNVLLILLDDVGFGASATFGGPVATPTADRLAAGGLRYRRFHTTALCSPTRAALLTGRNHHTVGMGAVADIATSAPGYTSIGPTRVPRWRRSSGSTGTRPHSSANVMKSRRGRPVRWGLSTAGLRLGVRALLRLRRRGDAPVHAGALPGHGTDRTAGRRGLPPDRRPGTALHRLDPPTEVVDAR